MSTEPAPLSVTHNTAHQRFEVHADDLLAFLSYTHEGTAVVMDHTSDDGMEPYEGLLPGLESEAGTSLRRISIPVPDMRIPGAVGTMREIMGAIRRFIDQAPAVYVHCWGGIGRTGMVVGCWLRELGYDPDSALKHVQYLYSSQMPKVRIHPESPQTNAQRNYVRRWEVES